MTEIFFAIGLCTLVTGVVFAFLRRHNTSECITCILLGILFSTLFLVFPSIWAASEGRENRVLFTDFSSVVYALKTLSGGQDIAKLEAVDLGGIARKVYLFISFICYLLAPIITSGLIISFIGDTGEKIRYHCKFPKNVHCFSSVSEKTLTLAMGIKKENKRAVIVFCNSKNCDKALAEKIRRMGGVLFYKPCQNVFFGIRAKELTFYLAQDTEDANINSALALTEKYRDCKKHRVSVNVFADNASNIQALEGTEKGKVRLHFIDEASLLCYQLLWQYPLHERISGKNGKKTLSVLIIGAGDFGRKMLKTVLWCGQLPDTHLKVRVFDKHAREVKEEFFARAPELALDCYDVEFVDTDVRTADFARKIKEKADDATLCVVSTGDDTENISAADTVFSVFRVQNAFCDTPLVLTRVRTGTKMKNLSQSRFLRERNIVLFGDISSAYSSQALFHSQLEKLGLGVHLFYCGVQDECVSEEQKKKREECIGYYYDDDYSRRSSMAAALHLPSKVYFADKLRAQGLDEETVTDILARNEHDRWNAFMRSEGYTRASEEQMKTYAPLIKKNYDKNSKLHNCLTDWDSLDCQTALYNSFDFVKSMTDKPDFKEYDYKVVRAAPALLKKYKKN